MDNQAQGAKNQSNVPPWTRMGISREEYFVREEEKKRSAEILKELFSPENCEMLLKMGIKFDEKK